MRKIFLIDNNSQGSKCRYCLVVNSKTYKYYEELLFYLSFYINLQIFWVWLQCLYLFYGQDNLFL